MSRRDLLRSHLRSSWVSTIKGPYSQMLINSERGLQVYFCLHLLELFKAEEADRRLFIEPRVVLPSGERRYPDLLICNSRRVIGVVELKYAPRALPDTVKDFDTLASIGSSEGALRISNERFRGPEQPREYAVADDAVLCWAAVHADRPFVADREVLQPLAHRFLELRAVTSESDVHIPPE